MIKQITKVICDSCEDMMAEYPFTIVVDKINEEVEEFGGLVINGKHFCSAGCYKDFSDASVVSGEEVKG